MPAGIKPAARFVREDRLNLHARFDVSKVLAALKERTVSKSFELTMDFSQAIASYEENDILREATHPVRKKGHGAG